MSEKEESLWAKRQPNAQEIVDRTQLNYRVRDLMEALIKHCKDTAELYNAPITNPPSLLRIEKTDDGFKLYRGEGSVQANFKVSDNFDRLTIERQSSKKNPGGTSKVLYIVDMGDQVVLKSQRENTFSSTPPEGLATDICHWVKAQELS
jgi:hypothetical protein